MLLLQETKPEEFGKRREVGVAALESMQLGAQAVLYCLVMCDSNVTNIPSQHFSTFVDSEQAALL
jgi:hypothetical protein